MMLESVLSFPNLSFVGTSKESAFVDYPAANAPSLIQMELVHTEIT